MRLPWQQAPASLQPINTSEECVWQMLECYLWYGCSRGTSNRLRRKEKKKTQPMTLLLYPTKETTVRRAQKARLRGCKTGSKRRGSRKAGRQRRGEQQGTGGGGKWKEAREKEQGGGEYQGKSWSTGGIIPRTEKPDVLQSVGSQTVGHDCSDWALQAHTAYDKGSGVTQMKMISYWI